MRVCGDKLRSVILFGSVARREFSQGVSDVDLIFIVSDDTPGLTIKALNTALGRLEAASGLVRDRSHFLWVFASRTALLKSHFIIRHATLVSLEPSRLFKEAAGFNLPLGSLFFRLAPKDLVISNILKGSTVVWGENLLSQIPQTNPKSNLGRVFIVSIVISLFGALSSLLFYDGTFFSLEAVKWFLLDANSPPRTKPRGLREAIILAQERGPSLMLQRLTGLREQYHRSVMFSLACPFYLCFLFVGTSSGGLATLWKIRSEKRSLAL